LDARFIKVAHYPQSATNIVAIPKKGGTIRMCVDFRDLNNPAEKMISQCHT